MQVACHLCLIYKLKLLDDGFRMLDEFFVVLVFELQRLIGRAMKKIIQLFLVFVCVASSGLSWAACVSNLPGGGPIIYNVPSFNTSSFNPDVALGTVIDSRTLQLSTIGGRITCSPSVGVIFYRGTTGALGAYNTYPTGIAGVGIRLRFSGNTTYLGFFPYTWLSTSGASMNFDSVEASLVVELVKVGPITAGGVIGGEIGEMSAQGGTSKIVSITLNGVISVLPQVPTCGVFTSRPVSLGEIPVKSFSGVGIRTTPIPFNINLFCTGGSQNAKTDVWVAFTDSTSPANRTDVLSLTSSSTASGIGIQLSHSGTLIKYGAGDGVSDKLFAGSTGNGVFVIPLVARYIQVSPRVTPGSANGRATFTITYQ